MLNTYQIVDALTKDPVTKKYFKGVYPIDKLPSKIKKRPAAIVANTHPADKPGRHWVAIFYPKFGKAKLFDSLGRLPKGRMLGTVDSGLQNRIFLYNRARVQPITSHTCGHYCIYYIYHRSRNIQMPHILWKLRNINHNDRIVQNLTKRIFVNK